jgi:hypothetical protein
MHLTKAQLLERLAGGRKFATIRYKVFLLQTPNRYVYDEIYTNLKKQFVSIKYTPELNGTYSNGTSYSAHIVKTPRSITIPSLRDFFIRYLNNELHLTSPPFLVVKRYNIPTPIKDNIPIKLEYSDNEEDEEAEEEWDGRGEAQQLDVLTQDLFGAYDNVEEEEEEDENKSPSLILPTK